MPIRCWKPAICGSLAALHAQKHVAALVTLFECKAGFAPK
jgi:hypothetical protein